MNYECTVCGFKSCKLSEYHRHTSTKKHNKRIRCAGDGDDDVETTCGGVSVNAACYKPKLEKTQDAHNLPAGYQCRVCYKMYSARSSLWYHEKKCTQLHKLNNAVIADVANNDNVDDDCAAATGASRNDDRAIIDKLLKDNAEMMKFIKEIVPRIGNTLIMNTAHNKFNINVFLNEQCKDAINISDFVNSLKITMQDLNLTGERGLVESITNVLVQGLNGMDVCKRPIHCTDLKRDILYVKDNEQWGRDETQEHIRKSVNDIAYKQIVSVQNWKNGLPDIHCDENLQLQYNTLLLKTLADTTGEKDVRKIVKSVCKHVYLGQDALQLSQPQSL